MDGRDIGSFVFPNADVKFYIDASIKTRSERRYNQLKEKEKHLSIREVENDLVSRDNIDKTRKKSPLIIPKNSLIINNVNRTIDDVLNQMLEYTKSIINKKNVEEIEKKYIKGLRFKYVEKMIEVINFSLEK